MTGPDGDDLRALVRATLRELLPQLGAVAAPAEPVLLRDDADLREFVTRVLDLAQDPTVARALREGRRRFTLTKAPSPPAAAPSTGPVAAQRITRGAVLERHVRAAEASGSRIVTAPGVVVTPLARERARASGVEIVSERSDA